MLESFKQLLNRAKPVLWVVVAGAVLFFFVVAYWILDKLLAYRFASSYVSKIAEAFDINRHLAEAITLVVAVAIAICTGLVFSLSKRRRFAGIGGLVALLVINSLVLWRATSGQMVDRSGQALKCYFFVGDQIVYGERPGFDPVTGRECRPVTPEVLQRLTDYQSGQKPKEIVQADVTFFDPRSGEPRIWYVRTKEGRLRLFDLRGFDPETGLALLPATRDVAAEWPRQHATEKAAAARDQAPTRIDPKNVQFFNPRSGAPNVWYWRSADGDFEFFDNEGFHPQTGDKLLPVSKEVVADYIKRRTDIDRMLEEQKAAEQRRILDKQAADAAEAARIAREETERQERVERQKREEEDKRAADVARRAKLEAEEKAQRDRDKAAKEQQLAAEAARVAAEEARSRQAAEECDRYAANPNDPRKPGDVPGVPYPQVRALSRAGVEACARATKLFPNEPRYKYQMARAYQDFDPKQAFKLFIELTQVGYPAAYDNLGSLYLDGRGGQVNQIAAARAFRDGANLQDPDAMVSYAKALTSGTGVAQNPELANSWYETAASRGHPEAIAIVDKARRDKQSQRETQEMMLDLFKGFINRIPQ